MNRLRIYSVLCALMSWWAVASAETVIQAEAAFNEFVQLYNDGNKDSAFPILYQSYEALMDIVQNPAAADSHTEATALLRRIFPYLEQGAYHYSAQNNQPQTLQYAQAYVSVFILPALQSTNLPRSANHVMLAKLAASGTWNSHDYAKSIPYLLAYIGTGDESMRLAAYNNLGLAYNKTNDFARAKVVLEEGLIHYPGSIELLMTLVDVSIKSGDNDSMQRYLNQALAVLPNHDKRLPTLLNTLGTLQERQEQYVEAIATFDRLSQLMPNDLNTAKHLGQDKYNAGVQYLRMSREPGKKNVQKLYRQRADEYFRQAEPLLRSIMASDPLSVKYALALATVYSCTGEEERLQTINEKLQTLGYEPIHSDQQDVPLMVMNEKVPGAAVRRSAPAAVSRGTEADKPHPASDVDMNIPINKTNNENTFAVIIANEDYTRVASVPMAENDGRIITEYCQKVLGLPKNNVRTYYNATALVMNDALLDIKRIAEAFEGNINVIFYYAGHGIPDEETKDAFLLPVDANGQSTFGCIPLNKLYKDLSSLNAHCVTVFLDACFSGSQRGDGMLASARGIAMKPKHEEATGNMVVFSAATDAQTAMPYTQKQHGLFTYFLLKKLKESKGNVTLGDLGQYLVTEVAKFALIENKKPQTPTVTPSVVFGDRWKNMKLIRK